MNKQDVLVPYISSHDEFFPEQKHYYLSNEIVNERTILYDPSIKFSSRLLFALRQIKERYILIDLEDMILLGDVDEEKLKELLLELEKFPYIRLLKSGISPEEVSYRDGLYKIKPWDMSFSITPTIWHRDYLIMLLSTLPDLNPWELEVTASEDFHPGLYWFNGESKRGINHWDSSIYPHICTAVCKGRWNISEYPELLQILNKFSIDPSVRGVC